MSDTPFDPGVSRRDVLKAGAGAVALAVAGPQLATPAEAQTPKRGGTFRMTVLSDPLHFDPHQTISFLVMVPLSFVYSRLVKVKAGPSVKPMTYPIEPDLAESWTQPNDTTYIFKLKKGVRWHNKPPVNGRELTADDVKYTYERFLTITGNPNKPVLEYVEKIEARRQAHGQVHAQGAERLVHRPARLDVDLDHRQGVRGEVRRPQEGRVGGRHRAVDARSLGAERQARLLAQPELLLLRPALRRRRRAAGRQGPRLAPGQVAGRPDRLRPRVPARGTLARRAGGPAAQARAADRRVHVVHQRLHRLQARESAVQRHPRPARPLARQQPSPRCTSRSRSRRGTGRRIPPCRPRSPSGRSRSIS